jgi:hypothetical protein
MTTTYTKIAKATGTIYAKFSSMGKLMFDDPNTLFDSSTTPFDGVFNTYTKVTKASGTSYTKIPKAT